MLKQSLIFVLLDSCSKDWRSPKFLEIPNGFYTSFGGKPKENNRAFTMRVSERLRHKQRAITPWDYERLVLEHFPQIYKVKCITSVAGLDFIVS